MNQAFAAAGLTVFERGWLSSNNVLFGAADAPPVLVDSGHCNHAEQTVALVAHALQGRPLARVVNTHLHSDHCGGNAALHSRYGCEITIPAGEADKVARWDEDALTYKLTGQSCPRFSHAGVMSAGDQIELGAMPWHVMASPGHDPESMVLYQPEAQILISADALWENGFGLVFPALDGRDGFTDVRATLDSLAALRVRWVIPGHGRPFEGFEAALERAHRRLDGLVADPLRHARHAAKVLIKFHVMELQRQTLAQLGEWIDGVPLLHEVHRRFGDATPYGEWWLALVGELAASGALRVDGESVANA